MPIHSSKMCINSIHNIYSSFKILMIVVNCVRDDPYIKYMDVAVCYRMILYFLVELCPVKGKFICLVCVMIDESDDSKRKFGKRGDFTISVTLDC